MKLFLLAFVCLLGVAAAVICATPSSYDCTAPVYVNRLDNTSATDLLTPEMCGEPNPFSWSIGNSELGVDHIIMLFRYHRYLEVQNLTGRDRNVNLYHGVCEHEDNKWDFKMSEDADYFYVKARIAFSALQATGCTITTDNNIYCEWWMTMFEHFKLGGKEFKQIQVVRWTVKIVLPHTLEPVVQDIEVWPVAQFHSAILLFEEYPPPATATRVIFLVMVHDPYMVKSTSLVPPDLVQGMSAPYFPLLEGGLLSVAPCEKYGTTYCYQQITVDLDLIKPCEDGGKDNYDGEYLLGGNTQCQPETDCSLPTDEHSWYTWSFKFTFETNDICPFFLTYNSNEKIMGLIHTYNSTAFDEIDGIFVADEVIYGQITITNKPGQVFPFAITDIHTTKLEIGVYNDVTTAWTYYELYPNNLLEPSNAHINFQGIFDASGPSDWFSMTLSSDVPALTLGIEPATIREFIFRASITADYDFAGKKQLQTTKSFSFTLDDGGMMVVPSPYEKKIFPSDVAAPATPAGMIGGVTVGTVAFVAAVIGAVVYIRRRQGYATQVDATSA